MILALLIAIAEGDDQSIRIRRTIPGAGPKRGLAFFFYSGSASGLAWAVVLAAATMVLAWLLLETSVLDLLTSSSSGRGSRWGASEDYVRYLSTLILYSLAYALFGLFIHRRFQPHRPPIFAAMAAVALPALWAIVPNLVLFFFNKLSWDALQERQLGSIFNVFAMKDQSFIVDHQLCALVLAAIGVGLNLKWFLAQRAVFQPLPREAIPMNEVKAPPPLP